MSNEVLIGIGGLVLSVLTYFAGVHRTKRRQGAGEREDRVRHVVDLYIANSKAGRTRGFHGLIQAGVCTLMDDSEIREACSRISQHGEKSPLLPLDEKLQSIDLLQYFRAANERGMDFLRSGNAEQFLNEFLAK